MAEIMNVAPEEINETTRFREACMFDSLMGFAMICALEEEYEAPITVDQFLACQTIGDLWRYADKKA